MLIMLVPKEIIPSKGFYNAPQLALCTCKAKQSQIFPTTSTMCMSFCCVFNCLTHISHMLSLGFYYFTYLFFGSILACFCNPWPGHGTCDYTVTVHISMYIFCVCTCWGLFCLCYKYWCELLTKAWVRSSFNKHDCLETASQVTPQGCHQHANASCCKGRV